MQGMAPNREGEVIKFSLADSETASPVFSRENSFYEILGGAPSWVGMLNQSPCTLQRGIQIG